MKVKGDKLAKSKLVCSSMYKCTYLRTSFMDIALNKIAKDEMSKAKGNPNYNSGMDSVDHIIVSSKPSHQHLLSIQG